MTMRSFYRFVLRLHPPDFRERFGDEMLSIFDEAADSFGARAFLVDACISLARQWLARPGLWKWAAATLGGMVPLIISFGSFIPWEDVWLAIRSTF
jgi:hypothetical protein